jgi:hypothetical protein
MSNRQLWFVRRGKTVSGHYHPVRYTEYLVGALSWMISLDKQSWRPLVTVRELLNELLELQTAVILCGSG